RRPALESYMQETYFLLIVLGFPLVIVLVALIAALLHPDYEDVLDWKPTRSPKREAELQVSDVRQMLAAQNRYRRLRGAPERTLAEVAGYAWASLELHEEELRPLDEHMSFKEAE